MSRSSFIELDGHDAYEILGLSPGCSPADIRQAHRGQQRIWHPDKHQDQDSRALAERRSRLLNIARDVLVHERHAYDEHRASPAATTQTADSPVSEGFDPWDEADSAQTTPGSTPSAGNQDPDPWEEPEEVTDTQVPWPPPAPPVRWRAPRPSRIPPPSRRGTLAPWVLGALMVLVALILVMKDSGLFAATQNPPHPRPAILSGTWTGALRDRGTKFVVTLRLHTTAQRPNGTARWRPGGVCPLAQTSATEHSLELTTPDHHRGCIHPGTWTITVQNTTRHFTFTSATTNRTFQGELTQIR